MRDGRRGLLLAAYAGAGRALMPVWPLMLRRRARRGHEDRDRITERFGVASVRRPPGPLVWIHAASVGETNAVIPLVRALCERGHPILFTTVTVTGATTARRALPAAAIHQFAPVDVRPWVRRFLKHWRPILAIFVESEVWPVMTDQLARDLTPHVIVNARMSERSFRSWRRIGRAAKRIFGRIALALAQTTADGDRLRALGVARVEMIGNLKFDAPPPDPDAGELDALRRALGHRPVWLAASTHPGEDEQIIEAHLGLAADFPGLVTIIVPRHPERGAAIAAIARSAGLDVTQRSVDHAMPSEGGVLVADTLGELGLFYLLVPVAFIGGSLVPRGGQNPIEAVKLGSAILHGPDVPNFAEVYAALDAAAGAIVVADAAAIAASVRHLLSDEPARLRQCEQALSALQPLSGALARTVEALEPFLSPTGSLP